MKKNVFLLLTITAISCLYILNYNNGQKRIIELQKQNDSLQQVCINAQQRIKLLCDSVYLLSFPADQRYKQALHMVEVGELDAAKKAISDLELIFPNSEESDKCKNLLMVIEKKEAQAKAEKERLKALGYKSFSDNSVIKVGDITYSFSPFSFGKTFTFDYCNDIGEYSYRTADKDKTYILTTVAVSTNKNYANSPIIIACKIVDGTLKRLGYFNSEYASWTSYGAKIGNYRDDSHDFSKVNTVRYKLGNEISIEDSKLPIIIIIPKEEKSFKDEADIEYAKENYNIVKIINRNKL